MLSVSDVVKPRRRWCRTTTSYTNIQYSTTTAAAASAAATTTTTASTTNAPGACHTTVLCTVQLYHQARHIFQSIMQPDSRIDVSVYCTVLRPDYLSNEELKIHTYNHKWELQGVPESIKAVQQILAVNQSKELLNRDWLIGEDLFYFILFLFIYLLSRYPPFYGNEPPIMCWCAVKNLLAHF